MKRITTTVLSFLILSFLAITAFAFQADITKVCCSPGGGCTENIVEQINAAKSEILVQAYSFTSAPIAKSLVSAHK
jgi:phosphatidylserine/phosphatidylglycerophosphate/cardiolipin synthase-like enzyme